jgi:hypothetical protein
VLAGLGVLAVMGALTWGAAAYVADNEEPAERLTQVELELGDIEHRAEDVAENGPMLFQGLGESRDRSIVVDHDAGAANEGWTVYLAHPADRTPSCLINQIEGTATFKDCDGRIIAVTDLASAPTGVNPLIVNSRTLRINLRGFSSQPDTTTTSGT